MSNTFDESGDVITFGHVGLPVTALDKAVKAHAAFLQWLEAYGAGSGPERQAALTLAHELELTIQRVRRQLNRYAREVSSQEASEAGHPQGRKPAPANEAAKGMMMMTGGGCIRPARASSRRSACKAAPAMDQPRTQYHAG